MRDVPIPAHISILFVEQEVSPPRSPLPPFNLIPTCQIIGDDTLAIESVLKADVWRDVLMREEATLNAKLQELEAENDEKRFDDARDEAQTRLTEVHARLAEMEAESGPARAAALLAGKIQDRFIHSIPHRVYAQVSALVKLINPDLRNRSPEVGECDWHLLVHSSSRCVQP